MGDKMNYSPTTRDLVSVQVVHFGKILFRLQFLALAVMAASVLSFIAPVVYYVFLLAVTLFTFGGIYALYPQFASWWSGGETLVKIISALVESWKYTVPIVLTFAAASVVCMCFDKREKRVPEMAVSVITGGIALIILILKLINKGGA